MTCAIERESEVPEMASRHRKKEANNIRNARDSYNKLLESHREKEIPMLLNTLKKRSNDTITLSLLQRLERLIQ